MACGPLVSSSAFCSCGIRYLAYFKDRLNSWWKVLLWTDESYFPWCMFLQASCRNQWLEFLLNSTVQFTGCFLLSFQAASWCTSHFFNIFYCNRNENLQPRHFVSHAQKEKNSKTHTSLQNVCAHVSNSMKKGHLIHSCILLAIGNASQTFWFQSSGRT